MKRRRRQRRRRRRRRGRGHHSNLNLLTPLCRAGREASVPCKDSSPQFHRDIVQLLSEGGNGGEKCRFASVCSREPPARIRSSASRLTRNQGRGRNSGVENPRVFSFSFFFLPPHKGGTEAKFTGFEADGSRRFLKDKTGAGARMRHLLR